MLDQSEIAELRDLYQKAVSENSPEALRPLVQEAAMGVIFGKLLEEASVAGLDFSTAIIDEGIVLANEIVGQGN